MRARVAPGLVLAALLLAASACEDLRQFSGRWEGSISRDPTHQHGFFPEARLRANVGGVTRSRIDLSLDLPGRPGAVRFEPIRHAADDVLSDLRFPGEPLRTYLGFVEVTGEMPYLGVVSLFAEERVEVRLIRGAEDAYGVFYLTRPQL